MNGICGLTGAYADSVDQWEGMDEGVINKVGCSLTECTTCGCYWWDSHGRGCMERGRRDAPPHHSCGPVGQLASRASILNSIALQCRMLHKVALLL